VKVGEGSLLVSCVIDDDVTIGRRCSVLEGSQIEKGAILEPDTTVPSGRCIPGYQVWGGSPARFIRDLDPELTKS
jgi:carbonic anhydrase/acetyltransferase-like protein (isoleucine patch superfamily)